jgi:hypothetical protein
VRKSVCMCVYVYVCVCVFQDLAVKSSFSPITTVSPLAGLSPPFCFERSSFVPPGLPSSPPWSPSPSPVPPDPILPFTASKEVIGGENLLLLGPTKGLPRWERLLFLGLRRRESDCSKLPVAGMAKGTWGEEADGRGLVTKLRKGERGLARGLAPKTRLRFGASEVESRLPFGASELESRLRFRPSGLPGRTGLASGSKMSVPGSSTVWSRSGYGSRFGVRAGELEPCPTAPKRLCMACGWTAGSGSTLGAEIMASSAPMAVLRSGDFWVGSWGLSALIVMLRCGPVREYGNQMVSWVSPVTWVIQIF